MKFFSILRYKIIMAEVGCLKDGHFQNLQVNSKPIYNSGLFTRAEKISDASPATRTLTESETNTVFIIDDAALALTLPDVSSTSLGVTYKFIISNKDSTAFIILTQGDTHWMRGYAIIVAAADACEHFLPDNDSESKFTLNGGTQGGLATGPGGDTQPVNEIVVTCIGTGPGPCWFVEALLTGTASQATPFANA